jgi:hypothetical protein
MLFVFYVAMDNPPFIETGINLLPTGQTGKGKQKRNVLELQARSPNARIVYMCATGISEVPTDERTFSWEHQLAVACRLQP